MTQSQRLMALGEVLELHPAVASAQVVGAQLRCKLEGYSEVSAAPWMVCVFEDQPPMFEVTVRDLANGPARGSLLVAARANFRTKLGAIGVDDDGEVAWRVCLPLQGEVDTAGLEPLVVSVLDPLFTELPQIRHDLLEAILMDVGLDDESCRRALEGVASSGVPFAGAAGGEPRPFEGLRPLLGHLRQLARAARRVHRLVADGELCDAEAQPQLKRRLEEFQKLEVQLEARLGVSEATSLPPALSEIVEKGREPRGRVLGLLAARAIEGEDCRWEPSISLRRLGSILAPRTWPRDAGAMRDLARQLVDEGLAVAGGLFEDPKQSPAQVCLNSFLQLSPETLETLIEALAAEGLGAVDRADIRGRIDRM